VGEERQTSIVYLGYVKLEESKERRQAKRREDKGGRIAINLVVE